MKNLLRLFIKVVLPVVLFAACATVPITGRKQLSLVPQSELVSMSASSYQQLLQQSTLSQNPQQTSEVNRVGKSIAASADQFMRENGLSNELKNYQWEFNTIKDDKTVNAFCMPGGKIAVYTGILPVTQNDAGLAVVVGHEVAHAIANHGGERMSQLLLTQLGGVALSVALQEKPQETQQLFLAAYGIGTSVGILLPYSRQQELEADHIGLILMARAGYDPRTAVPFWQRMNNIGGSRPPEFLSTHPATEKRIKDIQNEIPEALKYYKH